jgi:hypothetical protein
LRGQAQGGVDDHCFGLLTFDQHTATRFGCGYAFNFGGLGAIGHGASKKNDRSILHQKRPEVQNAEPIKGKPVAPQVGAKATDLHTT